MHLCKLFANSIHKDPPFRNPYVYLKEEEFIRLQKQKQLSESKLLKERKEEENFKHNQIILALDNLSNAVGTKKLGDTRKKLIKKKENLMEIIFPIESNTSSEDSSKEIHSNERSNRNIKENRGLFRFFTSHISKSTINSCLTSLCTKDFSDSEYTDITTTSYSPEAMNNDATNTTNTSICSSVVALKSKDSFLPSSDAAAKLEYLSSPDYSTTSYRISYDDNNRLLADGVYPLIESSSFYSLKTSSLPPGLRTFPKILELSINSNTYHNNRPFIKTVFFSDTILNCSRNTYSTESESTVNLAPDTYEVQRPENHDFPASKISYISNQKESDFYNIDGSIVLPKANYTDSQLSSFRERYHRHSITSNKLRLHSFCSNKQEIEPRQLKYTTHEQSPNELGNKICTRSFKNSEKNSIDYLSDISSNFIHRQIEEFESSSVYESGSDRYYCQDYLIL
ncbi:uncharacterized protein AC631_02838 [Debaryomyces fabryi]|uniref:Uncharacterized protein n=1 Tax=Debaryomyces fabryi TaxID=58627 RepID=A0A0V1PZ24_9ASCO|nr:uncharacterized protein AC631_02838 [Debaryomyces fabryi]KSA01410.1 hypothetical protein AC631_02838 [Debaryomyces fabryi]CUM52849.1 unnamed protein product [Debaryomyces fabryi]